MADKLNPYSEWLEIPAEQQPVDYYGLLGLERFSGDEAAIRAAAAQQVAKVKANARKEQARTGQRILKEIQDAESCLLDPNKRSRYDAKLQQMLAAKQGQQSQSAGAARPQVVKAAARPQEPAESGFPAADPHPSAVSMLKKKTPWYQHPAVFVLAIVALVAIVVFAVYPEEGSQPTAQRKTKEPPAQPTQTTTAPTTPSPPKQPGPTQPQPEPKAQPAKTNPQQQQTKPEPEPADLDLPPVGNDEPQEMPAEPGESSGGQSFSRTAKKPVAPDLPEPVAEDERLPIPEGDSLAAAEQLVEDLFAEEIEAAAQPEAKLTLMRKLLDQARSDSNEPAARYALLRKAIALAVAAPDPALALEATNELGDRYAVDRWEEHRSLFKELMREVKSPEGKRALIGELSAAVELAVQAEAWEAAEEFAFSAMSQARSIRDNALLQQLSSRRNEIREISKHWDQVVDLREQLKEQPADPSANTKYGKILCFQLNRWEEGLQHLAQGSDKGLADLASLEISDPREAEDQLALAEGYLRESKQARGASQQILQQKALEWYEVALPWLEGLKKVQAEKIVAQLKSSLPSETAAAEEPAAGGNEVLGQGMIGRITMQRGDLGALLHFEPGKIFFNVRLLEIFSELGVKPDKFQIDFVGKLKLEEAKRVRIDLAGAHQGGGELKLFINGRQVGEVGDGNKNKTFESYRVPMQPGEYTLLWQLSGMHIGQARIELVDMATDQALPVVYDQALMKRAKALPTRTEVYVTGRPQQ